MKKEKKEFILISLLFLIISFFIISGIIFNDKIIGRSLDFSVPPVDYLIKNNYLMNFYSWWGTMNGGARNSFGSALLPVNSVLYFPLLFNAGAWFIGRYQIILTLFLGLLSFYYLSRRIIKKYDLEEKNKIILSIIASLFFVFNGYVFCDIIFGSNAMYFTFALIPLSLYFVITYMEEQKKIYFILSLLSIIVISSTLQHLVMIYIFVFILSLVYKNFKFFIKLSLLHILLSLYWVLPLLYVSSEVVTNEMNLAVIPMNLRGSSSLFIEAIALREYFFHRDTYNLGLNNNVLSFIWSFNSFILLITSLLILFKTFFIKNKNHKKIILGFSIVFLLSLLFLKGGRRPFGDFVSYLYLNLPFFSLFRSLQHYIGFYVISISVLFLFSGLFLIKKNKNFIYLLFGLVFINAMPWWYTLDLGTKNITSTNIVPSYFNEYYVTKGDEKMYALNNLPLDFGILHAPPGNSINFFAIGKNEFNFITRHGIKVKSQGVDCGLFYGNKRFFATDGPANSLSDVLDNMEKDMYMNENFLKENKNLFSFFGVRYFIIRDDVGPVFPKNVELFNLEKINKAIDQSDIFLSIEKEDYVTIAKLKDFLPHFYTPQNIIITSTAVDALPEIISEPNYKIRSVIYFENQNEDRLDLLNELNTENVIKAPIIEFKKINPTKYRVKIHQANEQFPLIFSESFHNKWKAYPAKSKSKNVKLRMENGDIKNYTILDGSEDDQATERELKDFINSGLVSDLDDEKKIDFVSKNFYGTIQNENLSSGYFWENWFKEPIDENNHLMANGYSNSWIIDPKEVCQDKNFCIKNSDGTYDFELVIEFWPQRLFYIGLLASGSILFGCIAFMFYDWKKRRKVI
ncbi:MAG: hypothetical protein ABH881_00195 [bacterium]